MKRLVAGTIIFSIAVLPNAALAITDVASQINPFSNYGGGSDVLDSLGVGPGVNTTAGASTDSSGSTATMGCSSGGVGGSLGNIGSQLLGGVLNNLLSGGSGSTGSYGSAGAGGSASSGSAQSQAIKKNAGIAGAQALSQVASALNDALHAKADMLLNNPRTATPSLQFAIPDGELTQKIITERVALEQTVQAAARIASTTIASSSFSDMQTNADALRTYLANLSQAVGDALTAQTAGASEIQNYQAALTAANDEIAAAFANLSDAHTAYANALSQAQTVSSASGSTIMQVTPPGSSGLFGVNGLNPSVTIGGVSSFNISGLGSLGLGNTGQAIQLIGHGFSIDKLGNIYNSQGTIIGQGELTPNGAIITGGSSGILGGLSSVLQGGNIGGLINGQNLGSLVNILSGGSQAGQLIGGLLSTNLGSQAVSGILNSLGISGSLFSGGGAVGSLLGSSGLGGLLGGSGVGGLLGGALGVVGGVLGGGEVPVNDAKVRIYTQGIQMDQDTQLKVTCVQNVLVRQEANNYTTQFVNSVIQRMNGGNGGAKGFTQNPLTEKATLGNAVFNVVLQTISQSSINKDIAPQVLQNLVAQRQQQTDINAAFVCHTQQAAACEQHLGSCPGTTAAQKWQAQAMVIAIEPQCTASGATAIAEAITSGAIADNQAEYDQELALTNGIITQGVCLDPGKSQDTPRQNCVNWQIVTPPAAQTAIVQQAYTLPAQKQSGATEIGELVNSLFSQITSKVLTSLTGSVGLSQTSTAGTGTYLQQAVSNTGDATVAQAQSALVADIETSLGLEAQYESTLGDTLQNLTNTKTATESVESCYLTLATSTPSNIDSAAALGRANDASTTVATVLQPQIDADTNALAISDSVIAQLNLLDDQAKTAQSADQINAIDSAYQALLQSGALHSQTDLTFAQQDRDASKVTLDALASGASDELATCQKGG